MSWPFGPCASTRSTTWHGGWKRGVLLDQLLERVVHVLHLGAREGVDVARADDAVHEGDDLLTVDAPVRQSQARRAGHAEDQGAGRETIEICSFLFFFVS